MSDTAFQVQYRQEFVAGFEQKQSLLRTCCTTEAVIKGNQATFLVADSGSASAVTRGVNGLIPFRADNLTQKTATLAEWHDGVRKTDFNVFASQGDQRQIMQMTTMGVINRKIDSDILTELANGTVTTGSTASTATLDLVMRALVILGNAFVPVEEEDNMFFVASPAFLGYLMQTPEFNSADYVEVKGLTGPARTMRRWGGFNWIIHPNLTGAGTSDEKCFAFHRTAIGHAVDTAGIQAPVGYDAEQGYSWARASVTMGSKLLQNSGVVVVHHDGSALAAGS